MKLRIYILIIIALGLCSCTSDLDDLQGKDCIALTVYNTSMSTKANGDVTKDDGTERECLLTRLDIFLYPAGSKT